MIVVREIAARHVAALGVEGPVYLLAAAAPLLGKFGGLDSALVADRPGFGETEEAGESKGFGQAAVVVHLVQFNADLDVSDLLPHLGDHDVAVVLFRNEPDTIPLGRLLATLAAAGLRVLEARGTSDGQGRTVLAVTRDPALPMRSYAIGEPLPDTDEARLRLANEWQVERLQLKAIAEASVARRDAEVAKLSSRLAAAESKRDALARRVAHLERRSPSAILLSAALPPGSSRRARAGQLRRQALGLAERWRP